MNNEATILNGYVNNFGCLILTPPSSYNTPLAMYLACDIHEPKINIESSIDYLKNYPAETESMMKAKEYWLSQTKLMENINIACKNFDISTKEFYENLRNQAKEEVEFIRSEIWKKHVSIISEDHLTLGFHRNSKIREGESFPINVFSEDPNVNRANINIFSSLNIPKDFSFKAYKILEPTDTPIIKEKLKKRNLNKKDQKTLEILWKRHLIIEGEIINGNKMFEILEAKRCKKLKNYVCKLGLVATLVSTFVFFSSNIFSNLSISYLKPSMPNLCRFYLYICPLFSQSYKSFENMFPCSNFSLNF